MPGTEPDRSLRAQTRHENRQKTVNPLLLGRICPQGRWSPHAEQGSSNPAVLLPVRLPLQTNQAQWPLELAGQVSRRRSDAFRPRQAQ